MKLSRKTKITSICIIFLLVTGAFAILNGVFPGTKETHPPCNQLPTVTEVDQAMENNQKFVEKIEALGDGVQVHLDKPCDKDTNRGLIKVSYSSNSEHKAISNLLNLNEGLGVPVYPMKR